MSRVDLAKADARCSYTLIDTPGVSADVQRRTLTEDLLQKCDVPIVLAPMDGYMDHRLGSAVQLMSRLGHRPIFVITQWDRQYEAHIDLEFNTRAQTSVGAYVKEKEASIREFLQQKWAVRGDVHFVSSRWHQLATEGSHDKVRSILREAGMEPPCDEKAARAELRRLSRVPDLWAAIDHLVLRDADRRRAGSVRSELAQIITASMKTLCNLQGLHGAAKRPRKDDTEWRDDFEATCADIARGHTAMASNLEEALGPLLDEFSDQFATRMHAALAQLQQAAPTAEEHEELTRQMRTITMAVWTEHTVPGLAAIVEQCRMRQEASTRQVADLIRRRFDGAVHSTLEVPSMADEPTLRDSPAVSGVEAAAPLRVAANAGAATVAKHSSGLARAAATAAARAAVGVTGAHVAGPWSRSASRGRKNACCGPSVEGRG